MKNKNYYGKVSYRRKNSAGTTIGILVFILLVLVAFIIWAIVNFAAGGEGIFTNQTTQLSELKIENESLKLEIEELKTENSELKAEIEEYKLKELQKPEEDEETNDDESETSNSEIQ